MQLLRFHFLFLAAVVLAAAAWLFEPAVAQSTQTEKITVVYPRDGARINALGTFLLGSVPAASVLQCNGQPVRLNANGFFAHTVKLQPGINSFVLTCSTANRTTDHHLVTIIKPEPRKPIPPGKLVIDASLLGPSQDLGVTTGDLISLSIHTTPNCDVTAKLGEQTVKLKPFPVPGHTAGNGHTVHTDLVTEYGVTYDNKTSSNSDLYTGFYKVSPTDSWKDMQIVYEVSDQSGKIQQNGKAKITAVPQPLPAHTTSSHTIVRTGPGKSRLTPLVEGVRLMVDGWEGSQQRCWLAPGHHVWIDRSELTFDPQMQVQPQAVARTINVIDSERDTQVRIPLDQRLPYRIEQRMNPNTLTLQIYGATSDTDWITNAVPGINSTTLDHVTCRQLSDNVIEITAHLKNLQWGFWADYDNTTLILHIKSAPRLITSATQAALGSTMETRSQSTVVDSANNTDLKGLTVCVDPGHGGSEPGATGPSGIHEASINLDIASKLAQLLAEHGAAVFMTRTKPNENPSLQDRPDFAISHNADLLISIHNNALPNNRDPWTEHGTSTYWYHPQAINLAQSLKKPLVTELSLRDYGTFFDNLALTRPSNMPACLVEVGFMTNPDEYAQLIDPEFRTRAAQALTHGIESYVHAAQQQHN